MSTKRRSASTTHRTVSRRTPRSSAKRDRLEEYAAKRDFRRSPEPRGGKTAGQRGRAFVVQKHAASRLHYDFRLELGGVLKSWAIPKGPSLDPSEKRLAVHVEDHPIEYRDFEGVIPEGEYGAGTVLVWDRGTWEPEGDPVAGYRSGRLTFRLNGRKLRGDYSLIRMGGRAGKGRQNWLLIKRQDDAARPTRDGDVVKEEPDSVLTGRSLEEIRDAEARGGRAAKARSG